MARVKRPAQSRRRRRALVTRARGYYGNKSRSWRAANEQLMHSGNYAFRDRRARKNDFRRLWDPADQRGLPPAGNVLQPLHRRAEGGRHRGRPQDPGRPGGQRPRRVLGAGRIGIRGLRGPGSGELTEPRASGRAISGQASWFEPQALYPQVEGRLS